MITDFLGHPVGYWLELQKRQDEVVDATRLLEEIVKLQGKVSFYENRIKEMFKILTA